MSISEWQELVKSGFTVTGSTLELEQPYAVLSRSQGGIYRQPYDVRFHTKPSGEPAVVIYSASHVLGEWSAPSELRADDCGLGDVSEESTTLCVLPDHLPHIELLVSRWEDALKSRYVVSADTMEPFDRYSLIRRGPGRQLVRVPGMTSVYFHSHVYASPRATGGNKGSNRFLRGEDIVSAAIGTDPAKLYAACHFGLTSPTAHTIPIPRRIEWICVLPMHLPKFHKVVGSYSGVLRN